MTTYKKLLNIHTQLDSLFHLAGLPYEDVFAGNGLACLFNNSAESRMWL
jgi:hypothetical protein